MEEAKKKRVRVKDLVAIMMWTFYVGVVLEKVRLYLRLVNANMFDLAEALIAYELLSMSLVYIIWLITK